MAQPSIVVSGGTGMVGSALVPRLGAIYPDHEIVILTRRPQSSAEANVIHVSAALQDYDLGLGEDVRRRLQRTTRLFVHCGADTRFGLPIETARLTNTVGTRNALNFALGCRSLEQFAHVSTLYIAGNRPGPVPDGPLRHDAGYVNSYEQSKHEAEELVLASSDRLPAAIYRLSSVVDETGTRGHFRQLIRFVPWSARFPVLAGLPDVPVDLIPARWAAQALAVLIAHDFQPGGVRHVCAGPALSLKVRELMDLVFDVYEASVQRNVRRPQLVSRAAFESMRERLRESTQISGALTKLMTFIPHLAIAQPFDPGAAAQVLAGRGVSLPAMRPILTSVVAREFARNSFAERQPSQAGDVGFALTEL